MDSFDGGAEVSLDSGSVETADQGTYQPPHKCVLHEWCMAVMGTINASMRATRYFLEMEVTPRRVDVVGLDECHR